MKKIIFLLSTALLLSASVAQADIPQSGYFLSKDGVPLTEEQITAPSIRSNPMKPISTNELQAMMALPQSVNTLIELTVTEDGYPTDVLVKQSSGSIVLDQYAINSVNDWTFSPSKLGDKSVKAKVSVPVHFVSMKVVTPATIVKKELATPSKEEKQLIDRSHPVLQLTLSISDKGFVNGIAGIKPTTNLSAGDMAILKKYMEKSIKSWTFTPAKNPEGIAISDEITVTVPLM